ncbi:hypothetical protein [Enterococcus phoeniculicola]|jgi:hypothetical protein|uniref:LXG domain-containing protein n=1 Tax=Enterococcus phoeniculicola ATCC BAA-412 TaxID=1158610 RepID=R3TJ72_9ENTE|nr:hypothetical protein [Enterococcus phoeniculicola]EOL41153.1 hypothetical protein UC3_03484 [Enterococcus phoeniculicola ATCC BAA-412]EOT78588.1 hypothetical protein I589_00093 [Enterococcus phoeniculicola ATCC BAA-412]
MILRKRTLPMYCIHWQLLSETVEKAVSAFPEEYLSQVDSIDLKQSELEEQIRKVNRLLNEAREIRTQLMSTTTGETPLFQLAYNLMVIGMYTDVKKKLEEKLRKLLLFDARSTLIFLEIDSLRKAVAKGIAQTKTTWNGATGTFTVPNDLSWKTTIQEKWVQYDNHQKGINPEKNEELANYNVYVIIYPDMDGNPKILWQIEDKETGYGVTNPELYRYLSEVGPALDSNLVQIMTYEAFEKKVKDGWRNRTNYITGESYDGILGGVVYTSQQVEDISTWLDESEMGGALQTLGFAYASYRLTTTSDIKQVENDTMRENYESSEVFSGNKNGKNYILDKSKNTGNASYKKDSGAGGLGPGNIGNFSNLQGSSVDDSLI